MIETIRLIGACVIVGILNYYLIPYSKKRAENIATKKDIEDLTEKVEKVKTEFLKELEVHKLKASMIDKIDNIYLDLLSDYVFKSDSDICANYIEECSRSQDTVALELINNKDLLIGLNKLCSFLQKYQVRYKSDLTDNLLLNWVAFLDLKRMYDNDDFSHYPIDNTTEHQHFNPIFEIQMDLYNIIEITHDIATKLLRIELPNKF